MRATLADNIIYGSLQDVEYAIKKSPDLNQLDEYGFNPIVQAAIMRRPDVAASLLRHGCSVDLPDATGRTALHWAADNQDMPSCKLLLDKEANPNAYSLSSQPVLAYPYLRNQTALKNLLYQNGANLHFVQDYLNTKLMGHRFALTGQSHVVNADGNLILVDFEGFIFEFTASLIEDSLQRYINNYAAKDLQVFTKKIKRINESLNVAATLIKYQQYSTQLEKHEAEIDKLLDTELLVLPMGYTGHALTGIKFHDIFIKCDRGEYGRKNHTVTIYKIKKPKKFTKALCKQILYKVNPEVFIHYQLNEVLGLQELYHLPLTPQVSGNCSWANVEATIPAMLFLLYWQEVTSLEKKVLAQIEKIAMDFFNRWKAWDQDRTINECIQSFHSADVKRKATKAQLLTNVLVHRLSYNNQKDIERAEHILPVIRTKEYEYILRTYVETYTRDKKNPVGRNLEHLLDIIAPGRLFKS